MLDLTNMIILLDGSKGAGKSTTAELLNDKIETSVYLSLDKERRSLSNQEGTRQEKNNRAFEVLLQKSAEAIGAHKHVIIDCGLVAKRKPSIEKIAKENSVSLYKFLLRAPYDIQLERVRGRDTSKGQETDEQRFDEVHNSIHDKSFEGFTIIETDKYSPEEVVDLILKTVK